MLQQQIDDLQERIEENQGEAKNLQEQMQILEKEKKSKEIRIRQLELTFRSKHISLPVESVEAAQVLSLIHIFISAAKSVHPVVDDIQDTEEFVEEATLSLDEVEKEMIRKALDRHHGKRKNAAKDLNISERTLYRKIKEYGLD